MNLNFCPICGIETIRAAKFCYSCGQDLRTYVAARESVSNDPVAPGRSEENTENAPLPELILNLIGARVPNLSGRFAEAGWTYKGSSTVRCQKCDKGFHVFRKPFQRYGKNFEYWAVVCALCGSCHGLDGVDEPTKKALRDWLKLSKPREPVGDSRYEVTQERAFESFEPSDAEPLSDKTPVKPEAAGSEFTPTDEQQTVLSTLEKGRVMSVEALAGTGKTTTLRLIAGQLGNRSGTYVAFNKAIVNEAKQKFDSSVNCVTAHSLAFRAVGKSYSSRLNATQRMDFQQIAEWLEAPKFSFRSSISNHVLDPDQVARFAQATVREFCKSVDPEPAADHVAAPKLVKSDEKTLSRFQDTIVPLARKIWADILLPGGLMRFEHDHYLKIWQLEKPTIDSDYILFDEAQDADPVMLDVIQDQSNTQLIFCGDQFQSIYEWRGAENALAMVESDLRVRLTQSFRFGPDIAEEANRFLKLLKCPEPIKGHPDIESEVTAVPQPDAILCRTNAGIISAVITEQVAGRKVSIVGGSAQLIYFAESCAKLMAGQRTGHPELAPFLSWDDVTEFVTDFPDEAQQMATMVKLVETYGTERLKAYLLKTVTEKNSDVVLSTVHRAKGREWAKVRLQSDFLHPDDMSHEDLRVAYVAVTRARESLDITLWDSPSTD